MKYHTDIDLIKIYPFYKAFEDPRYLLKDVDYSELPEVKEDQKQELGEALDGLQDQYNQKMGGVTNSMDNEYKAMCRLVNTHNIVSGCISIMRSRYVYGIKHDFAKTEATLKEYDYGIKYDNPLEFWEEINRITRRLKGLEARAKKSRDAIIAKTSDKETDVFKGVAQLNKLGHNINAFNDTMGYYISCMKLAQKNGRNRRKKNT